MCDMMRGLAQMEKQMMEQHGLTLNEAMVMCCIAGDTVSASHICEQTGLISSHGSKVIRRVEEKGYIVRILGEADKRQMLFSLTAAGKAMIKSLRETPVDVPEALQALIR